MTNQVRLVFCYAGGTRIAETAILNLKELREKHLPPDIEIVEIDVMSNPDAAEKLNVMATPMLMRISKGNSVRIIGDLSDYRRVIDNLDISSSVMM